MKQVKIIVAGAGSRGQGYAKYALEFPEKCKVVGVAEPREFYRRKIAEEHNVPAENVFDDWRKMAAREKFADAVVIATQDSMHTEPSLAFIGKGYHTLLEKPMAPSAADCRKISETAAKSGVIFAVCHVMRYTAYTRALKKFVDSGKIGDIVSVQHLEPVGYWHQAHSFVRGAWRNEKESSFMLLAKSCHDIDWLSHIVGSKCKSVSSFGSLMHFRRENQPAGASDRCVDCSVEKQCPYSAIKIYIDRVRKGQTCWPVDVLTTDTTEEGVMKALREGPYGRCVYACDNDVVDHQVVNMLFESGATVGFTMTAFNEGGHRKTRIFGSKGEVCGDGSRIHHYDFLTDKTEVIETSAAAGTILGGHGGGDFGLMESFVAAVQNNDPGLVLSGPAATLESHLMVFAAEEARRKNCVVNL